MKQGDSVDLVLIDGWEALALRGVLECFGLRVNLFPIGRPRHMVEVLSTEQSPSTHLFLSCHGDERGIVLPELAPSVARDEPFLDVLTPELLRGFAQLPGRVVISTGCYTGTVVFAAAFRAAGASAYIAPPGEPTGKGALYFVVSLSYHLLQGKRLDEAVSMANGEDNAERGFLLFPLV